MDNAQFAEAVAYGMPGRHFIYHGDGSTVDGLTFLVDGTTDPDASTPLPTLAQVQAWHDSLVANPPPAPPTTTEKVANALATIENDPTLAASVKQALVEVVQALAS